MRSVSSPPQKRRSKASLALEIRPPAQVHGRQGQRVVHGHDEEPGPADAAEIPEGPPEGLAEAEAAVLDQVMLIHGQVSLRLEAEVESAVAGQLSSIWLRNAMGVWMSGRRPFRPGPGRRRSPSPSFSVRIPPSGSCQNLPDPIDVRDDPGRPGREEPGFLSRPARPPAATTPIGTRPAARAARMSSTVSPA